MKNNVEPFRALFDMIGVLARKRLQLAERTYAQIGLNHTEARLLSLLASAGGTCSQETLSAQVHIDRSNVGRALQSLESRKLVDRLQSTTDKRAKLVSLTQAGNELVGQINRLRSQMAEGFFGDLKPAEAAQVLHLLQRSLGNSSDRSAETAE